MQRRIVPHLIIAYRHLELPLNRCHELAQVTVKAAASSRLISEIEEHIHREIEHAGVMRHFEEKMDCRALMWYQKIIPFLREGAFLDLGGGDGRTALRVRDEFRNNGKTIEAQVADILDYPDRVRGLPYTQMHQSNTGLPDRSFDIVFLGTVLHHVGKEHDDPLALVDEAVRLTKNRLIVIESIYQNDPERMYTMWIDWFYNRVLHFDSDPKQKVNVPFNFRKPEDWERVLEGRNLRVVESKNLNTFQTLNPEHHWLYVAEPRRTYL